MAKKLPVKKAAAKKAAVAVKNKAPIAKPASPSKASPAPAQPAPKAAVKVVSKPAPKPESKAAPAPAKAAALVKLPAPSPAVPVAPDVLDIDPFFDLPPASVSKTYVPPASTKSPASPFSLAISAQSSAGGAANGNTQPANILVIVTCGGSPVTDLSQDHFTLMEHFDVPGQLAPFSNNITSFRNAGTGAYLLQTKPITGAPWRSGHHLAQILVSSSDDHQGQVAVKIVIR